MFKYGQKADPSSGYRQMPAPTQNPVAMQSTVPTNNNSTQPGYHPQNGTMPNNYGATPTNPPQQHSGCQQTSPPAPPQSTPPADGPYISKKIYKINAKDKVMDFGSRLSVAKVEDYANVHGCGGKDHAPNSTVAVTICDYTKGKGDKSVTTSFNLEVEFMDVLYQAAMEARLGKLTVSADAVMKVAGILLNDLSRWETAGQQNPVTAVPVAELTASGTALANAVAQNTPPELYTAGNIVLNDLRRWQGNTKRSPVSAIPFRELSAAKNALSAALSSYGVPAFEYSSEKNNPYAKNNQGYVPVSKIYIAYTPTRQDGAISRYPWFIQIENFDAPLNTKQNGASSHDASKAVNRRSAGINLSADDFAAAMVGVKRFVRLWEMAMALPVVRSALKILAEIRERKKNNNAA